MLNILTASFTVPVEIGTTPASLLWMFPLLATVAIIYKATKMRVIFLNKFFKEAVILFLTLSVVMIAAAIGLNILVYFLTS
jgi:hypothetical protein